MDNTKCAEVLSEYMQKYNFNNNSNEFNNSNSNNNFIDPIRSYYSNKKSSINYSNHPKKIKSDKNLYMLSTKFGKSPLNRLKEQYDFTKPCNISSIPINTSKHSRISSFSKIKTFCNNNENDYINITRKLSHYNSAISLLQNSNKQINAKNNVVYNKNQDDDLQLSFCNTKGFEDKVEKIKNEIIQLSNFQETNFKSGLNVSNTNSLNSLIFKENENNINQSPLNLYHGANHYKNKSSLFNNYGNINLNQNSYNKNYTNNFINNINNNYNNYNNNTPKNTNQNNNNNFNRNNNIVSSNTHAEDKYRILGKISTLNNRIHFNNNLPNNENCLRNKYERNVLTKPNELMANNNHTGNYHRKYYSHNNLNNIMFGLSNVDLNLQNYNNNNNYMNSTKTNRYGVCDTEHFDKQLTNFSNINSISRTQVQENNSKLKRLNSNDQLTTINKSINTNHFLKDILIDGNDISDRNEIKEFFFDGQRVLAQFISRKNGIECGETSIININQTNISDDNAISRYENDKTKIDHQDPIEPDILTFVSENIKEENNNTTMEKMCKEDEFCVTKKINFVSNTKIINRQGQNHIAIEEYSNLESTVNEHSIKVIFHLMI